MLETLDLTQCKSSEDVRKLATEHWHENNPLPEKPAFMPYRPTVINAESGRIWFETVLYDRHYYGSAKDPELHLRSHDLKDNVEISLQEARHMMTELIKAINVMEDLERYKKAYDAYNEAVDTDKRDLDQFINIALKSWSESLKKK